MLDLNAMAIFAEVVDAHSFTAAAKRLGLSKSAVSKAILALETQLGVQLLHRTTRRLGMTEVGQVFYEACSRIITEATRVESCVGHLREAPRGTLRVNAPIALGRSFVLPALLDFQRQYPDIEVELTLQDDYVDLVATQTDVAVRVGTLADSSLVARKLVPLHGVVIAAPSYLARRGTPQHPNDLAHHDVLRYSLAATPDRWTFERDGERFPVRVRGPLTSNSGDAILDAAIAGVGVAIMPTFVAHDALGTGAVVSLLDSYLSRSDRGAVYAVFASGRLVAPKVRLFIDFLAERAVGNPLFGGCDEPDEAAA